MKFYTKILSSLLLSGSFGLYASSIDSIKIYTETYPPYNMKAEQKLTGLSVEILDAMLKQMHSSIDVQKDIKLVPWARGYRILQKKKDTMLFSTARIPQREKLFKWVGPIVTVPQNIIALKTKHIKVSNLKDLKNYTVGGILGWSSVTELMEQGFKKSDLTLYVGKNATEKAFKDMLLNKLDMFIYNLESIPYDSYLTNFHKTDFKKVYTVHTIDLYYAFNKKTDDKIVKQYQKALDTIKANGIYKKILKKYGK